MNKRHLPFWLFIISAFFILVVRNLFRDGMFMDGMIYGTVAHNLANGFGTFWHPYFSKTLMTAFHEQPPLFFGIEAIFFRIFGDSIIVERIYGLIIALITISLIQKLWKCLMPHRPEENLSWLAVLFWLCIPVCFWSFSNNMEEPTMGMFDLAAILYICRSCVENKKKWFRLFIAATMIIAASLCKGFQGLFPLAGVFFFWVVFRNISFRQMVTRSLFLLIVVAIFYGIILLKERVRLSYVLYFHNQLVPAFTHPGETHSDHFTIVEQLFFELIPVFILTFGIGIFMKIKKSKPATDLNIRRASIWLFLIGFSGTLPLMLTMKQSGFYTVTAMPYFAAGFAVLLAPFISNLIEQLKIDSANFFTFTRVSWLVLYAAIIFTIVTIIYLPKRDVRMLHDVYCTGQVVPNGSIISISDELYNQWSLYAYYSRYFYISLDASTTPHEYFLSEKNPDKPKVPVGYKLLKLPTQRYDLYIREQ